MRAGTMMRADEYAVDVEHQKQSAAEAAAELVEDGMAVGLGTGTTVAYLLPALARRQRSIRCVATSPRTEAAALALGIGVEPFGTLDRLDICIDGADQITAEGWLVKGGGGAHTREKVVAGAADRFVVIADSTKPVAGLHPPVPLELLAFGSPATIRHLGAVVVRAGQPLSPDGGVIADYTGPVGDPAKLAATFDATAGVVGHGLFPPAMVDVVIVGHPSTVERFEVR
jgi:ribose 5-phosphate isomerase A